VQAGSWRYERDVATGEVTSDAMRDVPQEGRGHRSVSGDAMTEDELRVLRKLVDVYREHGESSHAPSQAEVYFALCDAMPAIEAVVRHAKIAWSEQLRELERAKEVIVKLSEQRDAALAKAAEHERDWYAAKSEFGTALAKMREALRAAEKRELEALAELNEREADVQTLQTHIEVQREALQKTSKAVAKLVVPITKIEELLTENGCDCECEHCWEDHDEDCERCLACRISMAIQKEDE